LFIKSKNRDHNKKPTLIIGLGNTILTDDGVGIYVSREIARRIGNSDVVVKEASIGGLELIESMAGFERAILIDAVNIKRERVGSLIRLRPEDLKGGSAMSRHQISFYEALQLGRELNLDLPDEIVIYGINVKDSMTFGESCTEEVESSIPNIVDQIIGNEFGEDV